MGSCSAAARLFAAAPNGSIYYGLGVTEHSQGSTTVMAIANRRAKTEAQKPPASSSSYETDSESDEESSASEESPVKAPRPSDNSELMNRFRSRLQASGSRSPPKRYASDSD